MFKGILDHAYKRYIKSDPSLHPVLMAEPAVSSPSNPLTAKTQINHFIFQETLKALFNNVSTLKNLSFMVIHAISVFDKV